MSSINLTPALALFVLLATLLTIGCLVYLFAGVIRQSHNNTNRHGAINVEIAKDELNRLKDARRGGQLSEEEFSQARADLEARLAETLGNSVSVDDNTDAGIEAGQPSAQRGRWITVPGALLVAGAAAWLYQHVGDFRAFDTPSVDSQQVAGNTQNKLPSIEEMLPRLEAHLQTNPDDVEGWKLLGTTYHRLRRFHDADKALTRALELAPLDISIKLQLADSRVVLADGNFDSATVALIDEALTQEPDNVQGNWLRGMASEQTGDMQKAIVHWRRILPLLNNDPPSQNQLQQMIARAESSESTRTDGEQSSSASSDSVQTPETSLQSQTAATTGVSVQVVLSDALQNQLAPTLPVFVYARAVDGPPAPLAVARLNVSDLPATVVLDDTMAMIPAFKLSGFDSVTIGARVAVSGDPVAQPGDWFAEQSPVALPETRSVTLEIATAVDK